MEITEVFVFLWRAGKLRGYADIRIDRCFIVKGIKILEGSKRGLFVEMPSRRLKDGTREDVCHPLNNATRRQIEQAVIDQYRLIKGGRNGRNRSDQSSAQTAAQERAPAENLDPGQEPQAAELSPAESRAHAG